MNLFNFNFVSTTKFSFPKFIFHLFLLKLFKFKFLFLLNFLVSIVIIHFNRVFNFVLID